MLSFLMIPLHQIPQILPTGLPLEAAELTGMGVGRGTILQVLVAGAPRGKTHSHPGTHSLLCRHLSPPTCQGTQPGCLPLVVSLGLSPTTATISPWCHTALETMHGSISTSPVRSGATWGKPLHILFRLPSPSPPVPAPQPEQGDKLTVNQETGDRRA